MAFRLFSRHRIILFGKDLKTYARGLMNEGTTHNFSSQGSGDKCHPHTIVLSDEKSEDGTVWPDPSLGLLGPKDLRMPLPGNVGFSRLIVPSMSHSVSLERKSEWQSDLEVAVELTNYERQIQVLKQSTQEDFEELNADEIEELLMDLPQPSDVLECIAQDCPKLIRKDFADLFPGRDVSFGPLTVVTLSQKTKNDMSGWSESAETEREELVTCFIDAAKQICQQLQNDGYWSDFIDPTSGRPYLGIYTNATLFETDERYRYFGFSIEDLGCCKVIRHRKWGTHSFIGCLFTNAPVNSNSLREVLRHQRLRN